MYPINQRELIHNSLKVYYDSCFIGASLKYKIYVVAVACIYIAVQFLNLPTFLEDGFINLKNMQIFYNKSLSLEDFESKIFYLQKNINFMDIQPNQDDTEWIEFNKLDLIKKIHPVLELDDLLSKLN